MNRINGNMYMISTTVNPEGYWETAVFESRPLGIMYLGGPDERCALRVHARVEKIVAELPLTEWEPAQSALFEEMGNDSFLEADEAS